MGYSTYWTKNNLLHRCITDKDSCSYVIDTTRSKIKFSSKRQKKHKCISVLHAKLSNTNLDHI